MKNWIARTDQSSGPAIVPDTARCRSNVSELLTYGWHPVCALGKPNDRAAGDRPDREAIRRSVNAVKGLTENQKGGCCHGGGVQMGDQGGRQLL